MTIKELSDEFSTYLNSYSNTANIILDEYEKSVFLTKAQEQIILEYYSGRNMTRTSYEETEEIRRYLSNLINTHNYSIKDNLSIKNKQYLYKVPDELWFIVYEEATILDSNDICINNKQVEVVPITHDELFRIQKNPFRGATKNRILRLDIGDDKVELITKYNINTYSIRYIQKPTPIVLVHLPEELSINGVTEPTNTKLHTALHRVILNRAVELAIQAKTYLMSSDKDDK